MPTAFKPRRKTLPAYALYGEPGIATLDRLHCESIAERSRLHGWEIRPHRHAALFQLLVVEQGTAWALLDGEPLALQGPALVTVPALAAHGFRFPPDIQGLVFTVAEPHLATLLQPHAGLLAALMRLQGVALPAGDTLVTHAAAALRDEAATAGPWRGGALDAALLRLAVAVARAVARAVPRAVARGPGGPARSGAAPAPRALAHVQALAALVDASYRQQPTQAALAAQLGITPTQLNRACQQVLGRPALAVLHARLLLQAQRELAYTELCIKQIAFELGFADAAYFTRFFSRGAGCAPSAWRQAQRGEQHAASARTAAGTAARTAASAPSSTPTPTPTTTLNITPRETKRPRPAAQV